MIRCSSCNNLFDETIAANICPHCGHPVEDTEIVPIIQSGNPEDPRWLPVGTRLNGKYEIREVIGSGGFGVTYKVWDIKHSVYKAVKEYFQQGVVNRIPGTTEVLISAPKRREEFEYGRERLLNEARIVAKFQSPSIVRVDDFFEENNTTYMVMEYLELDTLEDYIVKRKHVLDEKQAVNFGVNICNALEEIHKAGVIHRDISPDNIFVSDDGSVKIIDFGSARLSKEDVEDRMIVLKPGFAPPEQYEKIDLANDKQQGWTDIYALGATLYFALTGKVPVESSNRKADADTQSDSLCDPKELNTSIPDYLNNAIMTAMAVNIHERIPSATDLKKVLQMERKILPLATVRKRKKARRTFGIAGGIVLALVLAVSGYFWNQQRVHENILEPAEIQVWYSVSSDESYAQQKEEVMAAIKAEVEQSDEFSRVTIELRSIPEEDYGAEIERAMSSDSMPSLFENRDGAFTEKLGDVSLIIGDINKDSCQFANDFSNYCIDTNMVPMAFSIPVVYVNTKLVTDYAAIEQLTSLKEFLDMDEHEMVYKPISLNPLDQSIFERTLPDFASNLPELNTVPVDDFYSGESVAYFSDTSDFFEIRDVLPGSFVMVPVGDTETICRFTNTWSISECEGDERIAASRYLAYFLSNFVQDHYFLQTSLGGMPLDKQTLVDYYGVRPVFEPLLEDCSIYRFADE